MINKNSETWRDLSEYCTRKIAEHQQKCLVLNVSEREADTRRGAIKALIDLVNIETEPASGDAKQSVHDWFGVWEDQGD